MKTSETVALLTSLLLANLFIATLDAAETSSTPPDKSDLFVSGTTQPQPQDKELKDLERDLEAEFAEDELLSEEAGKISDPLVGWNLIWFHFNDKLYYWVMKPTAKGWEVVLPKPARHGVKNFFINCEAPMRVLNNLFQGRFKNSGEELRRFAVNTTVGVLGFGDPATHWLKMGLHYRDMDQSLAKAEIGKGVYLVWPFLGPSSVRGTVGEVGDALTDLATIIPGGNTLDTINYISLGQFEYESLVESALDPYVAVRSGYVQWRDQKKKE